MGREMTEFPIEIGKYAVAETKYDDTYLVIDGESGKNYMVNPKTGTCDCGKLGCGHIDVVNKALEKVEKKYEGKEKVGAGKCVDIPEGKFQVFEKDGKLWVYSYESVETYQIKVDEPFCSCPDFNYNKRGRRICKHLRAAKKAGYDVADMTKTKIEKTKEEMIVYPEIPTKTLTPSRLLKMTQSRVSIDSVIEASKDGCGDGVLYDKTKIGDVTKADLVAMISRNMGIVSETIGYPTYETIKKPDGSTLVLVRAQAKAYHIKYPDNPVVRSATVLMDFKRIERESKEDKEGRTFADRIAETDACRRAELAMMGIPERSLVPMIKHMIKIYKGEKK